jgi:hypothetical protein
MKPSKNTTDVLVKMARLLKDLNTVKVVWSFGLALVMTIIVLSYLRKKRSPKKIEQAESLARQTTDLNTSSAATDSFMYLNNCLKWLYLSSQASRKINDSLVALLNEFCSLVGIQGPGV